jgi:hypothetical protein
LIEIPQNEMGISIIHASLNRKENTSGYYESSAIFIDNKVSL